MVKSGLIFGVVMFLMVLGVAVSITAPICACFFPLLIGVGAGYLAGVFDTPAGDVDVSERGRGAGAIAGGIAVFAYLLFGAINTFLLSRQPSVLGMDVSNPLNLLAMELGIFFIVGLVNLGLTALAGVWGCQIWYKTARKT